MQYATSNNTCGGSTTTSNSVIKLTLVQHACVYMLSHYWIQLAACVPRDRLLIESDAEGAGSTSTSRRSSNTTTAAAAVRRISDVAATCTAIAAHLGMSPQELADLTAANAQRAFSC
jgi:Tat protein secretion system quality control protein TatD with DNase activity